MKEEREKSRPPGSGEVHITVTEAPPDANPFPPPDRSSSIACPDSVAIQRTTLLEHLRLSWSKVTVTSPQERQQSKKPPTPNGVPSNPQKSYQPGEQRPSTRCGGREKERKVVFKDTQTYGTGETGLEYRSNSAGRRDVYIKNSGVDGMGGRCHRDLQGDVHSPSCLPPPSLLGLWRQREVEELSKKLHALERENTLGGEWGVSGDADDFLSDEEEEMDRRDRPSSSTPSSSSCKSTGRGSLSSLNGRRARERISVQPPVFGLTSLNYRGRAIPPQEGGLKEHRRRKSASPCSSKKEKQREGEDEEISPRGGDPTAPPAPLALETLVEELESWAAEILGRQTPTGRCVDPQIAELMAPCRPRRLLSPIPSRKRPQSAPPPHRSDPPWLNSLPPLCVSPVEREVLLSNRHKLREFRSRVESPRYIRWPRMTPQSPTIPTHHSASFGTQSLLFAHRAFPTTSLTLPWETVSPSQANEGSHGASLAIRLRQNAQIPPTLAPPLPTSSCTASMYCLGPPNQPTQSTQKDADGSRSGTPRGIEGSKEQWERFVQMQTQKNNFPTPSVSALVETLARTLFVVGMAGRGAGTGRKSIAVDVSASIPALAAPPLRRASQPLPEEMNNWIRYPRYEAHVYLRGGAPLRALCCGDTRGVRLHFDVAAGVVANCCNRLCRESVQVVASLEEETREKLWGLWHRETGLPCPPPNLSYPLHLLRSLVRLSPSTVSYGTAILKELEAEGSRARAGGTALLGEKSEGADSPSIFRGTDKLDARRSPSADVRVSFSVVSPRPISVFERASPPPGAATGRATPFRPTSHPLPSRSASSAEGGPTPVPCASQRTVGGGDRHGDALVDRPRTHHHSRPSAASSHLHPMLQPVQQQICFDPRPQTEGGSCSRHRVFRVRGVFRRHKSPSPSADAREREVGPSRGSCGGQRGAEGLRGTGGASTRAPPTESVLELNARSSSTCSPRPPWSPDSELRGGRLSRWQGLRGDSAGVRSTTLVSMLTSAFGKYAYMRNRGPGRAPAGAVGSERPRTQPGQSRGLGGVSAKGLGQDGSGQGHRGGRGVFLGLPEEGLASPDGGVYHSRAHSAIGVFPTRGPFHCSPHPCVTPLQQGQGPQGHSPSNLLSLYRKSPAQLALDRVARRAEKAGQGQVQYDGNNFESEEREAAADSLGDLSGSGGEEGEGKPQETRDQSEAPEMGVRETADVGVGNFRAETEGGGAGTSAGAPSCSQSVSLLAGEGTKGGSSLCHSRRAEGGDLATRSQVVEAFGTESRYDHVTVIRRCPQGPPRAPATGSRRPAPLFQPFPLREAAATPGKGVRAGILERHRRRVGGEGNLSTSSDSGEEESDCVMCGRHSRASRANWTTSMRGRHDCHRDSLVLAGGNCRTEASATSLGGSPPRPFAAATATSSRDTGGPVAQQQMQQQNQSNGFEGVEVFFSLQQGGKWKCRRAPDRPQDPSHISFVPSRGGGAVSIPTIQRGGHGYRHQHPGRSSGLSFENPQTSRSLPLPSPKRSPPSSPFSPRPPSAPLPTSPSPFSPHYPPSPIPHSTAHPSPNPVQSHSHAPTSAAHTSATPTHIIPAYTKPNEIVTLPESQDHETKSPPHQAPGMQSFAPSNSPPASLPPSPPQNPRPLHESPEREPTDLFHADRTQEQHLPPFRLRVQPPKTAPPCRRARKARGVHVSATNTCALSPKAPESSVRALSRAKHWVPKSAGRGFDSRRDRMICSDLLWHSSGEAEATSREAIVKGTSNAIRALVANNIQETSREVFSWQDAGPLVRHALIAEDSRDENEELISSRPRSPLNSARQSVHTCAPYHALVMTARNTHTPICSAVNRTEADGGRVLHSRTEGGEGNPRDTNLDITSILKAPPLILPPRLSAADMDQEFQHALAAATPMAAYPVRDLQDRCSSPSHTVTSPLGVVLRSLALHSRRLQEEQSPAWPRAEPTSIQRVAPAKAGHIAMSRPCPQRGGTLSLAPTPRGRGALRSGWAPSRHLSMRPFGRSVSDQPCVDVLKKVNPLGPAMNLPHFLTLRLIDA
uniref:Uncharacterized protein n=1 Tax=Chromera velia CCMP2878 TaxID=1169474 RepID=A0A0G4GFS9_9ALVE|eukprot:Cvel_21703.t1-p1 / transcript=Cvel_21703.t1 / gene=Cvel_21703 / organism=Chromera_velia_CCMP2878 / gene_product=hypothetical protein / transcript_product=hypothetical protein / location=Cvel_scaffold2058:18253-28738(+) / protein_length=2032 / sequence_SO=supercontig / SO=protein_coding / is_pseudo=false